MYQREQGTAVQDFRGDERDRLPSSADQFEFGNDVDPDSNYILDALLDLEAMIDEEKKQKQQLEKRFDDIRGEKKGLPPLKPAKLPVVTSASKNNMEFIAEEILELVQKRNELADAENLFLNKKPPTMSALADLQAQNDIRLQMMNQFGNNSRDGMNAEKRNSKRMLNPDAVQDMLRQADRGEPTDSASDNSQDDEEKKPKITRSQRFLQRVQAFEDLKNKKIELMRDQLKSKEENELTQVMLPKPQISEKSATLAIKVREKKNNTKKPLYKRVHEVVDQRKEQLKQLIKHYEEEGNEKFRSECTFKPKISEHDLDSESEFLDTSDHYHKFAGNKSQEKVGIDSFLDKQQLYEMRSREHHMNLKDYYNQVDMREVKGKPKISNASKKIAEGTRGYKPISEKLYELGKERPKKLEEFRTDYIRELL